MLPPIAFLVLYNIGGALSLAQVTGDFRAVMFTVISAFLGATAVFYSLLIVGDPAARFAVIRNAYIWAACAASVTGLIGYFDIAGLQGLLGADVPGPGNLQGSERLLDFLIPPLCFLLQGFMLGTQRRKFWSAVALSLIGGRPLLRLLARRLGQRGHDDRFARQSSASSPIPPRRSEPASSFSSPHSPLPRPHSSPSRSPSKASEPLFQERANLINYYDAGETGRFGDQLNSLPLLLDLPNGMGPDAVSQVIRQRSP